jgi:CheY-like chemotaxis protein
MSGSQVFLRKPEKPKILLVDDDRLTTEIRAEILRLRGFAVDVASSATEALINASITPFDAFILDYDMPDLDGLDLAVQLRYNGYVAPIIMLSGRLEVPDGPGSELLAAFVSKGEHPGGLIKILCSLCSVGQNA